MRMAGAGLDVVQGAYPARVARLGGWVLIDLLRLNPDLHGDPFPIVKAELAQARLHDEVVLVVRVRDSRPPPEQTRSDLTAVLRALGPKLAVISISLEGMGFRAVAFRSFVSAARLLGLMDTPLYVSTDLSRAMDLAAEHASVASEDLDVVRRFFEQGAEAPEPE